MANWSESCIDPRTGDALREYNRRADALRAAKFDPNEWREIEPYRCDKCDKWHCRPAVDDGPVPTDTMCLMCRGRDGKPKVAHPSADDALAAAQNLAAAGLELGVYPCPHGRGWHLTRG